MTDSVNAPAMLWLRRCKALQTCLRDDTLMFYEKWKYYMYIHQLVCFVRHTYLFYVNPDLDYWRWSSVSDSNNIIRSLQALQREGYIKIRLHSNEFLVYPT